MTVVVVMGVAGSGKTTVGRMLARALGAQYAEGDRFHPPANVEKMSSGIPLDDDDRQPWLEAMAAAIRGWIRSAQPTVLACSALKQRYRDMLSGGSPDVRFVYLRGSRELIGRRMAARTDHFMPAALLDSQFAALEEPDDAIVVDVDATPEAIVERAVELLGDPLPRP